MRVDAVAPAARTTPSTADSGAAGWQLDTRRSAPLPPLAWLLRAEPPRASLAIGSGVRALEAGAFEGTWVGDGGELGPLRSTTPFGSGVLITGDELYVITPGHMLEGVFLTRRGDALLAANSLTALLVATGSELDPRVDYVPLFQRSVEGVPRTEIPTTGGTITAAYLDNARLGLDGSLEFVPKPAEPPFRSFTEHRERLKAALASAIANAPGYEPLATISSGYDSAAVAVLAAELGCRRALTVADGKPIPNSTSISDSGEEVARRLGMAVESRSRLAYRQRDDLPEAEFMATGFSGEEVYLVAAEPELRGKLLISGFFGDGMWWVTRPDRPHMWRSDQSGSSLGEFRLRTGFFHVPLPTFGAQHCRVTRAIGESDEMRPWRVGTRSDKPIPRRILEEAGIPRDAFGQRKRSVSATIHADGPAVMAPASVASIERFAAERDERVVFVGRRRPPRWLKGVMKYARRLGLESVALQIERRKLAMAVHEPAFGSLLLRWGQSVVRPRYAELAPEADSEPSRAR